VTESLQRLRSASNGNVGDTFRQLPDLADSSMATITTKDSRLTSIELQMAPTRSGVHIGGADFVGMLTQGKTFADSPNLEPTAVVMLDELAWWAHALKGAREASQRGA
jgi:hypothetical protein